ncbi:unnamed protein product, partial [Effrenium voratum]
GPFPNKFSSLWIPIPSGLVMASRQRSRSPQQGGFSVAGALKSAWAAASVLKSKVHGRLVEPDIPELTQPHAKQAQVAQISQATQRIPAADVEMAALAQSAEPAQPSAPPPAAQQQPQLQPPPQPPLQPVLASCMPAGQDTEEIGVPDPVLTGASEPGIDSELLVHCHGCGRGFADPAGLRAHCLEANDCNGIAWQAAVNAVGCMPGAGMMLWCPACPDDFLGKWTGSVTKASALLRHIASASKAGVRESAPKAHAWFLAAFVNQLLSAPPAAPIVADGQDAAQEDDSSERRLQEWVSTSPPLMNIVGPLLAKPGPVAREAIRLELECFQSVPAPAPFGVAGEAGEHAAEAKKQKRKSKKGVISRDTPGYDFYNEDIPMDVFMACEDHTQRTADGVPVLDLLSDDEAVTLPQARATGIAHRQLVEPVCGLLAGWLPS